MLALHCLFLTTAYQISHSDRMADFEHLATTRNGYNVFMDPKHSHAATHLADTPGLRDVAEEVIPALAPSEDNQVITIDMERTIGLTDLVETTDADEIIYAKRLNRDNFTRFVKGRSPSPSSLVTMVLRKFDDGSYELWSVWIGPNAPSFPGGGHETKESYTFWENHALVWGTQEVQPGSETTTRPW